MQFPSFVERNLVIEIPQNHSVFLSVFVNSFPSCQNTLVISIHFLASSFPLYCFLLIGLQFTEFDIYENKYHEQVLYSLNCTLQTFLISQCCSYTSLNNDNGKNQCTLCSMLRIFKEITMLCIVIKESPQLQVV